MSLKPFDAHRVLITGVTGFLAHHVFEHIMLNTKWTVVGAYRNNTAGSMGRLDDVLKNHPEWSERLTLLRLDLRDGINEMDKKRIGRVDAVLHIAGNTHVDRSITEPRAFLDDNVIGTFNVLEWLRQTPPEDRPVLYYQSTDEVFGTAPEGVDYTEESRHKPGNPYSASKSAAEQFIVAYGNTYGIKYLISNLMNLIGERQTPEKYLPLVMNKILDGKKLLIHADPTLTKPGKRHYLHCRNAAAAMLFLLDKGTFGEKYNIVGDKEVDNLEMAKLIEKYVKEWWLSHNVDRDPPSLEYELVDFHSSRPGHDLRYGLDGTKLKVLGFSYPISFEDTVKKIVFWSMDNSERWL